MNPSKPSHEMPAMPPPISMSRLVIALGLVTFAAWAFWSSEGRVIVVFVVPLLAADLVMASWSEMSRPVPRKVVISVLGVVAVSVVCVFLFAGQRSPATAERESEVLRWWSQPAVVVVLWSLLCYCHYLRYRRSRQHLGKPPVVTESC